MCNYCKNLFSGKPINEELIDYPIIKGEKYWALSNQVYIDDVFLISRISDCEGNTVKKKKKRINYCPICGRKLVKSES